MNVSNREIPNSLRRKIGSVYIQLGGSSKEIMSGMGITDTGKEIEPPKNMPKNYSFEKFGIRPLGETFTTSHKYMVFIYDENFESHIYVYQKVFDNSEQVNVIESSGQLESLIEDARERFLLRQEN